MDWLQSVYSDGSEMFTSPSYPKLQQKVTIRLRLYSQNPLTKIFLRTEPEGEEVLTEMVPYYEDNVFIWYHVVMQITNKVEHYRFQLVSNTNTYWYNNFGIFTTTPLDAQDFRIIADFNMPEWVKTSIFYQIFPDRFCRQEQHKKLPEHNYNGAKAILKNWEESPGEYSQTKCRDFFGGDIKGIESKITYLKELGINAIYLNPIFLAPTNHRYDVQDYYQIDPLFGNNEQFANLVLALHNNHIKVILDGVFNHSGMSCCWFNRCGWYSEPGAFQSQQSEFYEFYCFEKHPYKYNSWSGIDSLPKFNYYSDKLKKIIYKDHNSVMQYWLDKPYNIDGWRIDAANMLARNQSNCLDIWREIRSTIKERFPDSFILGEHFFDASNLLQGEALDASMNYQGFTFPVRKWITQFQQPFSTEQLDIQLRTFRSSVSWQVAVNQYNLFASHDLPRLPHLTPNENLHNLAIVFLITYLGVPAILYGDELGVKGGSSHESTRIPMPWNQVENNSYLPVYQKLIQLRKDNQALSSGGIKTLHIGKDVYSYARFSGKQKIIVVLNRGEKTNIELDLQVIDVKKRSELRIWNTTQKIPSDDKSRVNILLEKEQFMVLLS